MALPPELAHLDSKSLKALAQQAKRRLALKRLEAFRPFPKQAEFVAATATNKTTCYLAGNRAGKSEICAATIAILATGQYPGWWNGKRFDDPVTCIVAGHTTMTTRDVLQNKLIGPPVIQSEWGTGFIPKDCLGEFSMHRGVANAIDMIAVRHVSGGWSRILFKSFEMGVERWMGSEAHAIHLDEEPGDENLFTEALTRTTTTRGIVILSFTPLAGLTPLVKRLLSDDPPGKVIRASMDDNLSIPREEIETIVKGWAPHERDARRRGEPYLGSGVIFPISQKDVEFDLFPMPKHWPSVAAIDFGIEHPTAACKIYHDRESDCVYVTHLHRAKDMTPIQHCETLKAWGKGLPFCWPHDGLIRDKTSGQTLAEAYREHGLNMLPERVTFEDGGNGVEAGIQMMLERFQTGRLRIASHLNDLWEELRRYHRRNGAIVKLDDDAISALRYAIMGLRFAEVPSSMSSGPIKRGIRVV
jgi:phage terminase large subunit-like protein